MVHTYTHRADVGQSCKPTCITYSFIESTKSKIGLCPLVFTGYPIKCCLKVKVLLVIPVLISSTLFSAFMGVFVYALFGTSKDVTLGPTAILSLITASAISNCTNKVACATLLTFLCGIIQLVMGIFNLGMYCNTHVVYVLLFLLHSCMCLMVCMLVYRIFDWLHTSPCDQWFHISSSSHYSRRTAQGILCVYVCTMQVAEWEWASVCTTINTGFFSQHLIGVKTSGHRPIFDFVLSMKETLWQLPNVKWALAIRSVMYNTNALSLCEWNLRYYNCFCNQSVGSTVGCLLHSYSFVSPGEKDTNL